MYVLFSGKDTLFQQL